MTTSASACDQQQSEELDRAAGLYFKSWAGGVEFDRTINDWLIEHPPGMHINLLIFQIRRILDNPFQSTSRVLLTSNNLTLLIIHP